MWACSASTKGMLALMGLNFCFAIYLVRLPTITHQTLSNYETLSYY